MMKLKINGRDTELPDGMTVASFLAGKGLQPKSVVVEINRKVIEREKYDDFVMKDGDEVEIVRFIGGG